MEGLRAISETIICNYWEDNFSRGWLRESVNHPWLITFWFVVFSFLLLLSCSIMALEKRSAITTCLIKIVWGDSNHQSMTKGEKVRLEWQFHIYGYIEVLQRCFIINWFTFSFDLYLQKKGLDLWHLFTVKHTDTCDIMYTCIDSLYTQWYLNQKMEKGEPQRFLRTFVTFIMSTTRDIHKGDTIDSFQQVLNCHCLQRVI